MAAGIRGGIGWWYVAVDIHGLVLLRLCRDALTLLLPNNVSRPRTSLANGLSVLICRVVRVGGSWSALIVLALLF